MTKPAIIRPATPSGTLELLPRDQIAFQHMLEVIRTSYERFGYRPIETPVFERTEVLLTISGGETEKQVYFVQSTGALEQGHKPDLALRFDLTVPLARYVAEHEADLAFPFRRYQIQRVYRGERPQKGREREFYQCDIDVIGKDRLAPVHDAEMPAAIATIFETLKIGDFTIHISNRKILLGVLETLGVAEPDRRFGALHEIDKLAKVGAPAVRAALTRAPIDLPESVADQVLALVADEGRDKEAVLARLRAIPAPAETLKIGVAELSELAAALVALGVPDRRTCFDLAIVRGLDYYTGTVYETLLDAHPGLGSVCSGGRYDNLAGHYTRSHLPGVGISIGATRLFWQLRELGLTNWGAGASGVLVTQMEPGVLGPSLELATRLRQAGINTEVYLEPAKLDKQLKFATRVGIRLAVMLGADERAAGTVTVKDLTARSQATIPAADLIAHIRGLLDAAG